MKYLRLFTGQLHGKTIFSKIDLTKGYHQIPIAEADKYKMAVITPWGLFEFNRLPMGLANFAQAFLWTRLPKTWTATFTWTTSS